MKPATRLEARVFRVTFTADTPGGGQRGHEFDLCVAGVPGEPSFEVAFVGSGKIGEGMDQLLKEVGLWVSRALQGRDPMTGKELQSNVYHD